MTLEQALEQVGGGKLAHADAKRQVWVAEPLPGLHVSVTWEPSRPRTYTVDVLTDGERLVAHSPREVATLIGLLAPVRVYALDPMQEV